MYSLYGLVCSGVGGGKKDLLRYRINIGRHYDEFGPFGVAYPAWHDKYRIGWQQQHCLEGYINYGIGPTFCLPF